MTREDQLVFCKKCTHKKADFERGLVCGITNEFATFESTCPDFVQDLNATPVFSLEKAKGPVTVGSGKRFANYIIDRIVLLGLGAVFGAVLGAIWMTISPENFYELELFLDNRLWQYLLGFVIGLIYYSFIEGVTGRSIGKFFTKTKVIMEDGEKPGFEAIFVRSLCRFIPFEPFSFLGDKPIGWHDTMSKTRVVDI